MSRFRSGGLFVLLAAVWGTAFMAIKAGLAYFPPVLFAAIRYDIAALLMLGYAASTTDRPLPRGRREWLVVGIGGVFLIAGYHAFLFVGQRSVTAALAAVVVALSPILTTAFAGMLLPSERLGRFGVLGMGIGFLGVIILARPDPNDLITADVVATALIFLAAISFALGSVLVRRTDPAGLPIETLEAWSMIIGAILLHLISVGLPAESVSAIRWTGEAVAALLYLSVVASAFGFLVYFELLDRLGPVEINLVSYVAPVFAALAGWVWLGESIDLPTVVGFLVIFTGFCLIKRRELIEVLPLEKSSVRRL